MQEAKMADHASVALSAKLARPAPQIVRLRRDTVYWALKAGWQDFRAAPLYGLVFSGACILAGYFILALIFLFDLKHFAYPLITGFALIAPFVAAGFYEVSRRLEAGADLSFF